MKLIWWDVAIGLYFWSLGAFDEAKLIHFDTQKSWYDGTLDPTIKGMKQIKMIRSTHKINK